MTRLLGVQTAKEVRQLLPWWVAVSVALVALGQLDSSLSEPHTDRISIPFILTYLGGAIALGALAIGHEYSYRTLAALLAQPVDRNRLLLRKLGVLIIALISLVAVARWQMPVTLVEPVWTMRVLVLPAMVAVFVAPWWTMASRGPLAGAIFCVAVPILLLIGTQFVSNMNPTIESWLQSRDMTAPDVMWWGTLLLCGVGAVMTWRSFVRLQAIDGPHAEVGVPTWLRRTERPGLALPAVRSSFGLLLRKELHLHQMTFLATGAYLALWIGVVVSRAADPEFLRGALVPAQIIYAYLIALLAGSVTSAEERQIGTADWQLLLPVGGGKQWMIKAATALSLTALLAIALPYLLASIKPFPDHPRDFEAGYTVAVLLVCVCAMYVSSLSTSGMRAFLASLPVLAGSAFGALSLMRLLDLLLRPVFLDMLRPHREALYAYAASIRVLNRYSGLVVVLTLSLLLLTFAGANHRTVDRSRSRILRQAGWLTAALVVLAIIFGTFVTALAWVALIRER